MSFVHLQDRRRSVNLSGMHAVSGLVLCSALVWSIVPLVGSDGIEVGRLESSHLEQASSHMKARFDKFPGISSCCCQQCGVETRLLKDSQSFTYLGVPVSSHASKFRH